MYTSEGCNSCPPADRWLSKLAAGSFDGKVIPLAFHVDYWNSLGWVDRYSDPRFSERQRVAAKRAGAQFIYTPQMMLNGQDWRPLDRDAALAAGLAAINAQPARSEIHARIERNGQALHVVGQVSISRPEDRDYAQVWIALFENGLSTAVRAGENGGKTLQHDFVVRELRGPLRMPVSGPLALDQRVLLRNEIVVDRAGVAIFVQRYESGETLQALSLPHACWS